MTDSTRVRGPKPERILVRMYQVGFGDGFLVSFQYRKPLDDGRAERHMLVDLGSTHRPRGQRGPGAGRRSIVELAAACLKEHTGGHLDVLVNTHRHRDHLSGFGDPEASAVIKSLHPRVVVRSWTEHPDLPRDATAPRARDPRRRFASRLAVGQELAAHVESLTADASATSTRGGLAQLAADQVPNPAAIAFLDELAASTGGGLYLSAGMSWDINEHIPGIRGRVLGPPTLDQLPAIANERANDPKEFWLGQQAALGMLTPAALDPRAPTPVDVPAGPVAWIVDKLAHQQVGSLARIVRTVDDALNNTSLILLLDVGDKRLLLPGDAQIENWSWSLQLAPDAARQRRLLANVDLYKVGHHGSRNATPKSLFALWGAEPNPARPMTALLSTMSKVHGKTPETAVPRGPLVAALKRRMTLVRTDELADDAEFVTVSAPTRGREPFRVEAPIA